MGIVCCSSARNDKPELRGVEDHPEKDKQETMPFQDILERNMVGIIVIQKLQTKERTFDAFINRKGLVGAKYVQGDLSLPTLRLLN